MPKVVIYFLIFCISALTLLFEFLQIRIFSFQYWYHIVYFVITTALLGIAVGGTVFSVCEKLKTMGQTKFYALCFLWFAASVSVGTIVNSFIPIDFDFGSRVSDFFYLAAVSFFASAPYAFFGLAMARAWFEESEGPSRVYLFNLTGSVFGLVIFVVFLGLLGAERLIYGLTVVSLLIFAWLYFYFRKSITFETAGKFLIITVFIFSVASIVSLEIKPVKSKLYWTMLESPEIVFSEWNPVARIDVIKNPDTDSLAILNDGDAQTSLPEVDLESLKSSPNEIWFSTSHRGLVYVARDIRKPLGSVLVIGSGGGADVIFAYNRGSRDIDAVEVNSTTVRLVKEEFSPVIGNIFKQDGVRLFNEDGRSFIKKTAKKYDIITLLAVDTFAASNAGAYVMTENYPYTLEAFEDYWDHLSDDGFIQISRFYYQGMDRETLRVFTTFFEALRNKGIKEPEKHMVVMVNSENVYDPFGSVIVSKKPIGDDTISRFDTFFKDPGLHAGLLFPKLGEGINERGYKIFKAFSESWKKDSGASFYRDYFFDVRPATDDKPFFFQYGKFGNLFKPAAYTLPGEMYFNNIRWQRTTLFIFWLFLQSCMVVSILIFMALRKIGVNLLRPSEWLYPFLYFCFIGIGFMFMEMALIQKLVLFFGHPTYSLAIVLTALFSGAAAGSYFSSKLSLGWQRFMALVFIVSILILAFLLSYGYFDFMLGLNLTTILVLIFIGVASLGFFAGIPFPAGIVRLSQDKNFIPAAWTINAGFSVIGSVAAIIFAMLFGFSLVMILAATFYFLYFILTIIWDRNWI